MPAKVSGSFFHWSAQRGHLVRRNRALVLVQRPYDFWTRRRIAARWIDERSFRFSIDVRIGLSVFVVLTHLPMEVDGDLILLPFVRFRVRGKATRHPEMLTARDRLAVFHVDSRGVQNLEGVLTVTRYYSYDVIVVAFALVASPRGFTCHCPSDGAPEW